MYPVNMPVPVHQVDGRFVTMRSLRGKPELVVEVSCLESHRGSCVGRLYDDACDVGLGLQSQKTGNVTHWYQHTQERDAEGDTVSWKFYPTPCSVKKFPALKDWSLTILND